MSRKLLILCILLSTLAVACQPTTSAEDLAVTYVAATEVFTTAVAEAVGTGIAATTAAQPTETPTSAPTRTPKPTSTTTFTPTPTGVPTDTLTPTITNTPEPTVTSTPTAGQIKTGQLYAAIRNLKYIAEQLVDGLDGQSTGYVACSPELRTSVVVNYEAVKKLPSFDDSLLSQRAIGANIAYTLARNNIIQDANIIQAYNNCIAWLNAGKPTGFANNWGDLTSALGVVRRALILADEALNN